MRLPRALVGGILLASVSFTGVVARKPNIVFVFTDDQDYHHNSLDYMPALQTHLVAEGTSFTNHYATIAICCPSRVSLMRGQAAHNTNNTAVNGPGGGYGKFTAAGEDDDYLPHWLLDPYINVHNSVVMSQNGEKPVYYQGWQQSDVVRVKALARLEHLVEQEDPFFLMIAPTAPHVENATDPPTPPSRYKSKFANLTIPQRPNFNPPDELHKNRPSWWAGLPRLNETQLNETQRLYQRRIEALQGVDDIIEDVINLLRSRSELDNTYVIFSTDQGYHLGTHRDVGKCSPYIEDANIPLVVRGPGVKAGQVSRIPSTVTDFAPTFLDITGLGDEDRPPFLDGTSMLQAWENPDDLSIGIEKEAINVEFWGRAFTEIPTWTGGDGITGLYRNNTYKTMRIVNEDYAWVYSRWCTGDTELYDSLNDPYEMTNLAGSTDPEVLRVMSRLNALLMVMKSCETDACRHPWGVIQPPRLTGINITVSTLAQALDPAYDEFFASIPAVTIAECMQYQFAANEIPYYPPEAQYGLGLEHRNEPKYYEYPDVRPIKRVPYIPGGGWEQRHAPIGELLSSSRTLTAEELQQAWNRTTCNEGSTCTSEGLGIIPH
ncbi:arylsulfatase [Diaporthe helianthi]|uniref:Arylsulfatase n=1 Tax=Diaporthe helianthi TaxID=158607 RepID=A0A2P5HZH9_DIAHE|nr:arylsulfatase [Diaporthe helianthi]